MIVIPAVDIKNGKCVQLVQGKPGTEKYYGDPVDVALGWQEKGAELLHVVDLDATLGDGNNLEVVKRIKQELDIPVQFGGGIRDEKRAREVLDAGIDRIIIGTMAIKEPKKLKQLAKDYGKNRMMVAVDSLGGKVVVKGWTEKTDKDTIDLITELEDYAFGFLLTDVDREGMMDGIDIDEFRVISESTDARICVSGGISSQGDIEELDCLGIWGCVIGKALYESKVTLDPHKNRDFCP